jgi:hypothetical protein
MNRFAQLLQREPAAVGSLIASLLPALVVLGVIRVDEEGIAVLVLAANTVIGFIVRATVSPRAAATADTTA